MDKFYYNICIYGIYLVCYYIISASGTSNSKMDLVDRLLKTSVYNKMDRPGGEQDITTKVEVDLFVSEINEISEISMRYHVVLFLRQRWQDKRLSYTNHELYNSTSMTLNYHYIHKMWQPDMFLKNEVTKGSFHDITVPNILINLFPNGTILYSQRISTKLSCNMDLQKFPFDQQKCFIRLESYGYKISEMLLQWNNRTSPIQVNTELQLPEFNLSSYNIEDCTVHYTTGTFSCIQGRLNLTRLRSYYIIQVYIPTVLIVMLSWVSFWIDYKAVPARISVGLLTVLTITTKSGSISSKLPKVSYIKAIDVWMFTCTVFVFTALVEYSIVNVLARRPQEQDHNRNNANNNGKNKTESEVSITRCHQVPKHEAIFVDVISRYIYPAAFVIFNLFYWIIYLYQDW